MCRFRFVSTVIFIQHQMLLKLSHPTRDTAHVGHLKVCRLFSWSNWAWEFDEGKRDSRPKDIWKQIELKSQNTREFKWKCLKLKIKVLIKFQPFFHIYLWTRLWTRSTQPLSESTIIKSSPCEDLIVFKNRWKKLNCTTYPQPNTVPRRPTTQSSWSWN